MAVVNALAGGKTTPRLLQDLSVFDPLSFNANASVLTAVPFHDISAEDDPPLDRGRCEHRWCNKKNQSILLDSESHESLDTSDEKLSSYCEHCRCHLTILVRKKRDVANFCPCPTAEQPLHHFILDPGTLSNPTTTFNIPDDKQALWSPKHFRCTAAHCKLSLSIEHRPPRLKPDWVSLLVDKYIIKARAEKTIANDPEKFQGHGAPTRASVLEHFYRLVDRVLREPEGKPYPRDGKQFMLNFGEPCAPIFEALGFRSDGSSWHWPRLDSEPTTPYQDVTRVLLDDVREEIIALMLSLQPDEKQIARFDLVPQPVMDPLRHVLGNSEYRKNMRNKLVDPNDPEHPFYASLGSVVDFHDDLIYFAYRMQIAVDPKNIPYYLEALQTIAEGRVSEELGTKAAIEESKNRISLRDIRNAYSNLGIDFRNPFDEDHIIGIFHARIADAPKQGAELRRDLKIVGVHRGSVTIQNIAAQVVNTYEQALSFLEAESQTPDEFIPSYFTIKADAKPNDMETARQAVAVIAKERKSQALEQWLDTGQLGHVAMDVNQAYARLGIPDPNTDEDLIITQFNLITEDQAARVEELKTALRTIAADRDSQVLKEIAGIGSSISLFPISEWPVGLNNIGNTCYLNSLLQFYFSIKPFRDLILNIAEYKSPLEDGAVMTKRVGGRIVTKKEVVHAQRLAEQLRELFCDLITSPSRSVRPDTEVVRLTLLTPKAEIARRKSIRQSLSEGDQPRIAGAFDHDVSSDAITSVTSHAAESSAVPSAEVDQPQKQRYAISDSSDETLVDHAADVDRAMALDNLGTERSGSLKATNDIDNSTSKQPENQQIDSKSPAASNNSSSSAVQKQGSVQEHAESIAQSETTIKKSTSGADSNRTPIQPPPVPPRPKVNHDQNEAVKEAEFAAQQQDVNEIAYNILNQMQCAIRPQRLDKAGEQLDQIKQLFYGKQKTYITKQSKVRSTEEYMSDIRINVQEGPVDIYAALDGAFDVEDVAVADGIEQKHSAISELPPILQIHIQRGQYDPQAKKQFKSNAHLELRETIYLDRYMDSSDAQFLRLREESWEWKERLRRLEARRSQLIAQDLGMPMSDVLECAQGYLQQLQGIEGSHSIEVPAGLYDSLGKAAQEAKDELNDVDSSIQELRASISQQFDHLQKIAYHLAAVFIHRGSSTAGHYWIYIYDFRAKLWRKYNDESVTLVDDVSEIFGTRSETRPPTPYFLVYVKDEQTADLVDPVCRDVVERPQETPDEVLMDEFEPIDIGKAKETPIAPAPPKSLDWNDSEMRGNGKW